MAIYLCHRESVSWQNGRMAQWSAALCGGTVQMLSSLSPLACKLFWIGLDWIVLHTNENMESMVKGRTNPSALPKSRRINPINVIMWLVIRAEIT